MIKFLKLKLGGPPIFLCHKIILQIFRTLEHIPCFCDYFISFKNNLIKSYKGQTKRISERVNWIAKHLFKLYIYIYFKSINRKKDIDFICLISCFLATNIKNTPFSSMSVWVCVSVCLGVCLCACVCMCAEVQKAWRYLESVWSLRQEIAFVSCC